MTETALTGGHASRPVSPPKAGLVSRPQAGTGSNQGAGPVLITPPPGFSWRRTLLSHGWVRLPPFRIENPLSGDWALRRVLDLGDRVVEARLVSRPDGTIEVHGLGAGARARSRALGQLHRILGLRDDLGDFYAATDGAEGYGWIRRAGAGRLLRGATVFEDLVKTLCTTNCSWTLTESMVGRLVASAGHEVSRTPRAAREGDGSPRAFPRPSDLADRPESFFRGEVRAGYRSGSLRRLSDDVASGRLDVEAWDHSPLPTPELKKQILSVRGVGPYAAENLLRLLGRFDGLALDSWCRKEFALRHRRGRAATDRAIARHYGPFGSWQGLALWCDLTRDWLETTEGTPGEIAGAEVSRVFGTANGRTGKWA